MQVLNDFVAIGYAIPALNGSDVITVHDRPRDPTGPIAVLGPGTGLGQVQLFWDKSLQAHVAWASEGAHAGFAPRGPLQRELLEFAEAELEMPCEVEHLACGTGLQRIYRFVSKKAGTPPKNLVRRFCVTMFQTLKHSVLFDGAAVFGVEPFADSPQPWLVCQGGFCWGCDLTYRGLVSRTVQCRSRQSCRHGAAK
jgi:glucokinase